MIANEMALLKRELWEHRSIYVIPIVIGVLVSMISVTGQITISAFGWAVDVGMIGVTNLGPEQREAIIGTLMLGVSGFFAIAMALLILFYSLDSLYAERKDRSILFWRSMPCTDSETVISKLLTALLVIPLVTFGVLVVTHLVVLICASVWVAVRGGNAWHLIWGPAPFVDNWTATLALLLAATWWISPFVGWYLFVSAFTRRSPLLMALLPIAILPMLEKSLVGSSIFFHAFFVRTINLPIFRNFDVVDFLLHGEPLHSDPRDVAGSLPFHLFSHLDLLRFFGSPGLWLGFVACALFTTAAIYVRRYRDDS